MSYIGREDSLEIKAILSDLIDRSGALTSLLVSKEGISIAHAGDTSYLNITAMAALVAGMFSATREVARMVGEKQFSILLQQGETRHIHISLIDDTTMMVVIFQGYQRIGLVRLEARNAGKKLAEALLSKEEPAQVLNSESSARFKEYALNLVDQIFQS